ncbi:MAG: ATP-binding protein, partial [Prevotellaceae bacterium]|nr:ATP-binding protein [Prevotellaceae bacterium]
VIGKGGKYTTLECRYTSKKQLKLVERSIKYQDGLYASTTERIKRQSLANVEGGHLVVGVEEKTLRIVGTDTYNYTTQQATLRLTNLCANLSSERMDIEEFITEDTHKTVWVIHVPKHLPKLPVYAHNKAWQRIEDSLVELTQERLNAILEETSPTYDWSAEIVAEATLDDLEPMALQKAREE